MHALIPQSISAKIGVEIIKVGRGKHGNKNMGGVHVKKGLREHLSTLERSHVSVIDITREKEKKRFPSTDYSRFDHS